MIEEDLLHKIEDRRKGYNQQQAGDSTVGQLMKCFNCNREGHHWSICENPPFCYSCREDGHKSSQCPMKNNRGMKLCGFGIPGQQFYSLNLPEPKPDAEGKAVIDVPIRALVSVLEGRGTKERIKTELQYLMESEWDQDVKRISGSEFLVRIPSRVALNLLIKMGNIKFITSDIVAVVEETEMEPGSFQVLQSVQVRAMGFPRIARIEYAVMELAHLVGDPKEVCIPYLQWKSIWVKVASKNPNQIEGTSEVFINKQGREISWFFSEKLKKEPPSKPDDELDDDEDAVTDEEDPESQESLGWSEPGNPYPSTSANPTSSTYQGKQAVGQIVDKEGNCGGAPVHEVMVNPCPEKSQSNNRDMHDCQILLGFSDVFQDMNDMAVRLNSTDGHTEISNKTVTHTILTWGLFLIKR